MIDDELDELVPFLPAIAIEGLKGVGKTATAERRASTTHRLDVPDQAALAAADTARLLEGPPPVLLDEWQRLPEVWDLVRRAVDDGAGGGRFLLTGSGPPARPPVHSGAGRIATLRMRPMTLGERGVETPTVSLAALLTGGRPALTGATSVGFGDYVEQMVRPGLPGLRGFEGRALHVQLDSYLERLANRELPELGVGVRNPEAVRRWMAAYAAATATSASWERIRDAASAGEGDKPARATTLPYRDALQRLFFLDPLPAWVPRGGRLTRLLGAPKHHLADPALAARLLGADAAALLEGRTPGPSVGREGPLAGALFESLVALCVRVLAQQAEARVGHMRTKGGAQEVDLIVERADGRAVAIEVKLIRAARDDDVRHLRWLAGRMGDELLDAILVTTGPEAYRRPDGIGVVPAALLGP
ncbi:MAG: uncharacterized protein QOD86_2867 [Miltoncostaeaceae bacterium]|nr:uncharacterized protein [Miltoncostaeaceae bacterium]